MKALTGIAISSCLFAATLSAAKLPTTAVRGEYIEARTADVYTGACFANGEVGQTGRLAVMGWHIEKGEFQGVNVDGLSVVGVIRGNTTLGDVTETGDLKKAVIIIDEKASPEQQIALKAFAVRMGDGLFADVVRTDVRPISLTMKDNSVHSQVAELKAGDLATIATRALTENDQVCRHESVFYPPLTHVDHAMAAYTTENRFAGKGLGETWSSPEHRSAFVATFSLND